MLDAQFATHFSVLSLISLVGTMGYSVYIMLSNEYRMQLYETRVEAEAYGRHTVWHCSFNQDTNHNTNMIPTIIQIEYQPRYQNKYYVSCNSKTNQDTSNNTNRIPTIIQI